MQPSGPKKAMDKEILLGWEKNSEDLIPGFLISFQEITLLLSNNPDSCKSQDLHLFYYQALSEI
jgi:hypothetical protein